MECYNLSNNSKKNDYEKGNVRIPFISPFIFCNELILFRTIQFLLTALTALIEQINESTKSEMLSFAPRKNPLTWCQK
jgi:hypothetical protein